MGVAALRPYQRVYSSKEDSFQSEPAEVQKALQTVGRALEDIQSRMAVTWILDRGFDDIAIGEPFGNK